MSRKKQVYNIPQLKVFRRELRNEATPAEVVLWEYLKGKQLDGYKFRRQCSVDNFILDFYCPKVKLGIELDGADHYTESGIIKDYERTEYLNQKGIRIIRFENRDIFEHIDGVLEEIKRRLVG